MHVDASVESLRCSSAFNSTCYLFLAGKTMYGQVTSHIDSIHPFTVLVFDSTRRGDLYVLVRCYYGATTCMVASCLSRLIGPQTRPGTRPRLTFPVYVNLMNSRQPKGIRTCSYLLSTYNRLVHFHKVKGSNVHIMNGGKKSNMYANQH